jgi:hypothetical protein
VTATILLAALISAAPAHRDKLAKTGGKRPAISNVEGNGDAVVGRSKDGRPLVTRREKPLTEKVEDALRDGGKLVREKAEEAYDAVAKAVADMRRNRESAPPSSSNRARVR